MQLQGVLFDLDGTILDNNVYHLKAWKQYLKNIGREVSDEEYRLNFNGRTNKDVVEYIHKRKMTDEEAQPFYLSKEDLYREIYKPHIKPIDGFLTLLNEIEKAHIPMGIATSGILPNIDFMFDHIPIRQYFKAVIYSKHIKRGKPDPEIYIKAAEELNADPAKCVVFEDATVGIQSAKGAGMKVIAITTTHPENELAGADKIIKDYTQITLKDLETLFLKTNRNS
ncbi:MAG: HAD family hydrolase [Flavisolibacter sp.]